MDNTDKKQVINEKCDEYWTSNQNCFDCPMWKYIKENGMQFCVDVPMDKQYEILTGTSK